MSNTWLDKSDNSQEAFYTAHVNKIIVERRKQISLLIDIIKYRFGDVSRLRVLDLGCGDGSVTVEICKVYPSNVFHLLDGSADMLGRAKSMLQGDKFVFYECDFADLVSRCEDRDFDVVFSSNAIHHLDYNQKMNLYSVIYDKLNWGGLFLNLDFVLPESDISEQWQFNMWVDWINSNLASHGMMGEIHQYDCVPSNYKGKSENRPSRLCDQLDQLKRAGFNNVDCFYKYGVNAVFGGTK